MNIAVKVKPDLVETFVGFYDNARRRPGDAFELKDVVRKVNGEDKVIAKAESFFSKKWMLKVEPEKSTKSVKKKATSENLTL